MNKYVYIGGHKGIYTLSDLKIATDFNRIVHGKRGAYVEFLDNQIIKENVYIPEDKNWRLDYDLVYFIEYRSKCESYVKFYFQKKKVNYADYIIGRWYTTPKLLKDFIINEKL